MAIVERIMQHATSASSATSEPALSMTPVARPTYVLLGASNLTVGFAHVTGWLRRHVGGPFDVFACLGHGRSYGKTSRVIVRELPGIATCGLWHALDAYPAHLTAALLMDVGNDLFYGVEPAVLAEWVDLCARRLIDRGCRVAMAELPVENLGRVSRLRFDLVRTLVMPSCKLTFDRFSERALEARQLLGQLAERRGITLVRQPPEWYGWDRIHFARRARAAAWNTLLQAMFVPATLEAARRRRRAACRRSG